MCNVNDTEAPVIGSLVIQTYSLCCCYLCQGYSKSSWRAPRLTVLVGVAPGKNVEYDPSFAVLCHFESQCSGSSHRSVHLLQLYARHPLALDKDDWRRKVLPAMK